MRILGVTVSELTRKEALERCADFLRGTDQRIIVTPNPEILVDAGRDREFRDILNRADMALPDGFGLVLMAKILGRPIPERVAGSDFLVDLCQLAAREKKSVYFFGAPPGVASRARETLQKRFPTLQVAGADSGPRFPASAREIEDSISKIQNARPCILFVALGHGKQERWISSHLKNLPSVKIAMGVGGAFDFLAGTARRAPRFFRALGLEWLWRLLCEPCRLPRILKAVIVFPCLALKERLSSTGGKL